jgi:hypothetical protein|tara:strand:+ start:146 stop:919 length:774 start_codon:yes stop_codon:yes gene_type:complete
MGGNNKGQLTIFVIIGVIALLVVGVILVLNMNSFSSEKNSIVAQDLQEQIQECLKDTSQNAIWLIGIQGGYYEVLSPKEDYHGVEIPIYLDEDEITIPSQEDITGEIAKYMTANSEDCFVDFDDFEDLGYFVVPDSLVGVDVIIDSHFIKVGIEYPISISSENSTGSLEIFEVEVPFEFDKKYSIVKEIAEIQNIDKDSIHLTEMIDIAYENNFTFETVELSEKKYLFTLIFENEKNSNGSPFIWDFVNKYSWEIGQ